MPEPTNESAGFRPAKIAIAARSIRTASGLSRVTLGLTHELTKLGHSVDVHAIVLQKELVKAAGGRSAAVASAGAFGRLKTQLMGKAKALDTLNRQVHTGQYDLIVGNGDLLEQDVLILHNIEEREHLELAGMPHIGVQSSEPPAFRRPWESNFRLLISNSELMTDELTARSDIAADKIAKIYPGYDPAQFAISRRAHSRSQMRAALDLPADITLIGFLTSGHFKLRGIDILGETLTKLPRPMLDKIRILVTATRKNEQVLRNQFRECGLPDIVIAHRKTAEIENYYYALDLLFHPARFETFGLAVQEAAACGCPVVTSRSVGAAELFTELAASTVAERPDAANFHPLIERMVADSAYRTNVAGDQYSAVRDNTWQAYCESFLKNVRVHGIL